ncbi:MAG: type II CRISPR RNA-guided endonuclease Cas9 [Candidatus Thiothrix moscowensis]|nr:type II CRISPR RNA-guided endonuclease Cas9 [Candidatus Thiothrix moscowensis]
MASVGAALLANDHILGLHVRAFNKAETAKEGESLNKIRRDSRLTRRRLHRRAFRLLRLRRLFKRTGLLNNHSTSAFASPEASPWQLRAEGLDRCLSPTEWATALYHLVKHRGFQSTRKSEVNADEKAGQMLSGVSHNSQLIESAGYRTVGELAWKHEAFREAKRNKGGSYTHTFARADIESELNKLFTAQRAAGNPHSSNELEESVHKLLMSRRPALSGENLLKLVGKCTFETREYRAPKASHTTERFVWLTRLNNLRISGIGQARPLAESERQALLQLPFTQAKLTYKQVRKVLDLGEAERFAGLNYRDKDPEGATLFEAKYFHTLRKTYEKADLKQAWQRDCLDADRLDTIAYALTVFKEDVESRQWLTKQGVENDIIEAVLEVSFADFIRLSRKALLKILPFMEQGLRYDEAVQDAGYAHHSQQDTSQKSRLLPAFSKDDVVNPVVYRSLNQARKLVNAIVQKYGAPSAVHIELARDLSKPFDERKKIEREQKEFRANKEEDIQQFKAQFGFEPKGRDLIKWRLYREQDCKCAYSLKPFDLNRLYEDGYAEVDHALPYSRSFDDSMNNKVLVLTSENRNKGNRTPYEYLDGKNDSLQWREFMAWVMGNKKIRQAKRMKLLRKDFGKDEAEKFRERNLTDTRYACKLFKNHVETHLQLAEGSDSKRCVVVSGQLTAFLRARWGLIKVREDGDLHHALDAAVVAACSHAFVQRLSTHSRRGELECLNIQPVDPETGEVVDIAGLRQLEKEFPQPWAGFRRELLARLSPNPGAVIPALESVAPVRVSRAPQRRGAGAAHQETIRSAKQLEQGQSSVKVPLEKLRLQDFPNIVGVRDPRNESLMQAIHQRLVEHKGDGKKAFAEPLYKPCKPGNEANAPQVRSVRLLDTQKSGLPVRGGIANNGDILRVDIFTKGGKFFAVPLYMADAVKKELPNRAVVAFKPEDEWTLMDEGYVFLCSLHQNDWIKISLKKDALIEGYLSSPDRSYTFFLNKSGSFLCHSLSAITGVL